MENNILLDEKEKRKHRPSWRMPSNLTVGIFLMAVVYGFRLFFAVTTRDQYDVSVFALVPYYGVGLLGIAFIVPIALFFWYKNGVSTLKRSAWVSISLIIALMLPTVPRAPFPQIAFWNENQAKFEQAQTYVAENMQNIGIDCLNGVLLPDPLSNLSLNGCVRVYTQNDALIIHFSPFSNRGVIVYDPRDLRLVCKNDPYYHHTLGNGWYVCLWDY